MKNALESIGNRSDQMKEGVSELEDRNLEMIQREEKINIKKREEKKKMGTF